MLLVAIGWMYVVLMMAIAEAMHPNGTLLGAVMTVVLYGALPLSVVLYIMGSPGRRAARRVQSQTQAQAQVAAVLLAAGAGARMGHRPKGLLQINGQTLVQRQLHALQQAGVRHVVVVLGHHAQAMQTALANPPAGLHLRQVTHAQPNVGQEASLQLGLQALPEAATGVMLMLVDQPLIEAGDLRDLLHAFAHRGEHTMVVPRVRQASGGQQPGNPVVIDAALARQWRDQTNPVTGRQWRAQHPDQVYWWDTDNPHYSIDLDTPEDLEQLHAHSGHRMQWPDSAP
jgi:molybdenum cofactor cytidylyltransferase